MREMKDSGIEWIGKIPKNWGTYAAFQVFSPVKSKNTGMKENNLLSLSYGRIIKKNINTSTGLLPESFEGYNIIEPGDIVLRLTDLQNDHTSLRVGLSEQTGIITSAYLTLHVMFTYYPKFLYYQLHSFDICKGFYGMGAGVLQGLNWEGIKLLKIVMPDIHEQQRIADFLDRKCAEIDSVIEKTKATIEGYKKLKQSIITEAVTKGTRPNRPMKDSGIEWIGEIPEDWNVNRIKYVANFDPPCDMSRLSEDSIITYTPMECIKNGYFMNNTSPLGGVTRSLTAFQDGDIVMAKVTPCFENGNIAIMKELASGFGFGSSELFVFRPTRIKTKFLFYWLRNDIFMQMACSTMTGTGGLKRVSPSFVRNCYLHYPNVDEQTEISDYLDQKCNEIDNLISKKTELLTELETYKKSLIYEYVTGKKEVEI